MKMDPFMWLGFGNRGFEDIEENKRKVLALSGGRGGDFLHHRRLIPPWPQ